jgi:hypothetical protein
LSNARNSARFAGGISCPRLTFSWVELLLGASAGMENPTTEDVGIFGLDRLVSLAPPDEGEEELAGRRRDAQDFLSGGGDCGAVVTSVEDDAEVTVVAEGSTVSLEAETGISLVFVSTETE